MEIQMEMTWDRSREADLVCGMGSYKASVWPAGDATSGQYRMGLFHVEQYLGKSTDISMGCLTLPSERIACQVAEKALSLLAELDEKDAPTIDEMVEPPPGVGPRSEPIGHPSETMEGGNGASTEPTGMLGQGDPV